MGCNTAVSTGHLPLIKFYPRISGMLINIIIGQKLHVLYIIIIIYIRDSQLNRPESVSLASLARQLHGSANSPSLRALARGRGLSQHNFRGNPLL